MSELIDQMITCELERFVANDYRGRSDAPEFEVVQGSIPVMVSAPHAVTHWRDGHVKPSDDYTGSIALAIASLTGAHAIVATRFSHADPNWDPLEQSAYKQVLMRHAREHDVSLLLDLHGMIAASPALVSLGTADGLTCASLPEVRALAYELLSERLADVCARTNKPVELDGHRAARGQNTITRTIACECGITCIQIELSTPVRVPSSRGMHIPKSDPAPFEGRNRLAELSARRDPRPKDVEACVRALAELVAQSAELLD